MENSRNKQFISCKLRALLSSVMKSCTVLLHPSQVVNHAFAQHIHTLHALPTCQSLSSHLSYQIYCRIHVPLFYLIMAPKHRSSDAGNLNILLLCLIYKLNFIVCMYRKNIVYIGFSTICDFRHPTGFRIYPPRVRGDY